jgi:hypothetical protein
VIAVVGFATAMLGAAVVLRPGDRALALDVYLLAVGALALLVVISRTIGTLPRERPSRLDRRPGPRGTNPRPRELLKLEREVGLSIQTAFDTHFRLRPTLRRIADARLRARGVDLDGPGSEAEALVGPEAWELIRPDRMRPRRHDDPGSKLVDVDAAVAALERL